LDDKNSPSANEDSLSAGSSPPLPVADNLQYLKVVLEKVRDKEAMDSLH
jgi:hypothetical protein